MVYRSTRAAKARGMDEATLKQILAEAIAELPDKDYITELVENLEKKINENEVKIDDAEQYSRRACLRI